MLILSKHFLSGLGDLHLHPVVGLCLIFGDDFLAQGISHLLPLYRSLIFRLMHFQLFLKSILGFNLSRDPLLSLFDLVLDFFFFGIAADRKMATSA